MAFGSTANTRIAYIAESAFGTTPANPTFKEIRRTGGGLALAKGTVVSNQIQSSRDVRAEVMVSHDVNGNIPFEFSQASFNDFLEAVLGGTWATNVLKTGSTQRFFTFEETIPVGATNNYHRFLGCSLNTMELNFNSRAKVEGSVGIMGKQLDTPATSIISGATYTAPNTEAIHTADKVATLDILGETLVISNFSLSVNNNLRLRPSVGSLYSAEYGFGQIDITGSFEAYFSSNDLLDAILAHTSGAIELTFGIDANEKYTFDIPAAQLLNGNPNLGGKDDDVMQRVDFRACYDASESTSLKITRAVA